ncbi:MAG TPA: LuxR C-terminal-related transcriptional regulator [Pirellulaceae bacterium]|nr:LuxR C-terminal-related transcriptional regulator [Pirellulaceae bacterium]
MQRKLSQLTPRERQVLDLVLDGKLSKQIARELNITTKTVEVHRSNVTRKMEVGSVAQLFKQMNDHRSKLTDLMSVRNVDRHDTPH